MTHLNLVISVVIITPIPTPQSNTHFINVEKVFIHYIFIKPIKKIAVKIRITIASTMLNFTFSKQV